MGLTILRKAVLVRVDVCEVRAGLGFLYYIASPFQSRNKYKMNSNTKIVQKYLQVLFIAVLSFLPFMFHKIT